MRRFARSDGHKSKCVQNKLPHRHIKFIVSGTLAVETSTDADCRAQRSELIRQAKLLCDQQGHYLWGAQGQKPSASGPVGLVDPKLDPSDLANTQFCAAKSNGNVCVGRFRAPAVRVGLPVNKIWNAATDDLLQFVNANKANPGAQIGWSGGLTPRRVTGYTGLDSRGSPTDYEGGGPLLNRVVWGEGCDDCQHFDCHGFVNYVVLMVCGQDAQGIENIEKTQCKNKSGQVIAAVLKDGEEVLAGDLLCFKSHIAFVLDGGAPDAAGVQYRVVQAESAVYGLNYGKPRTDHIKCIRLSPSTLLRRPV